MVPKRSLDETLQELKRWFARNRRNVRMVPRRSLDETLQELKRRFVAHRRAAVAAVGIVCLLFVVGLWALTSGLPSRDELRSLGEMPQATTLYDVHNRPVFTIFKEYRIEVPLAEVSPHLRRAIVAFEDQRFANHSGIDIIRIFGAVWADLREGRRAQGGSTLTQQLARQSFLTREKRLWRKVQEIALARRIERMYSKDRNPRALSKQNLFRRRSLRR